MKKSKILGAVTACLLAAVNLAVPASADDVDLDGTYHAYLGVQSASYTFRNAFDEPNYGYGVEADDGTFYFDRLTGWDGPTALNMGGTFTDAEITGNGTYSVKLEDLDFGNDETLNLLFISTDIPVNDTIKFTDVKVILDGQSKYTFDEAYIEEESKTYLQVGCINTYNPDLKDLFAYIIPGDTAEIQFTVSGFNYDNPNAGEAEEPEETEAVEDTPEDEPAAEVEDEPETEATESEATTQTEATEAETEATEAAAATTAAPASSSSDGGSNVGLIVGIIAVVVVIIVVVVIVIKKKS